MVPSTRAMPAKAIGGNASSPVCGSAGDLRTVALPGFVVGLGGSSVVGGVGGVVVTVLVMAKPELASPAMVVV